MSSFSQMLQTRCLKMGKNILWQFLNVDEPGPFSKPLFHCRATVGDVAGVGWGHSRETARQNAARDALNKLTLPQQHKKHNVQRKLTLIKATPRKQPKNKSKVLSKPTVMKATTQQPKKKIKKYKQSVVNMPVDKLVETSSSFKNFG